MRSAVPATVAGIPERCFRDPDRPLGSRFAYKHYPGEGCVRLTAAGGRGRRIEVSRVGGGWSRALVPFWASLDENSGVLYVLPEDEEPGLPSAARDVDFNISAWGIYGGAGTPYVIFDTSSSDSPRGGAAAVSKDGGVGAVLTDGDLGAVVVAGPEGALASSWTRGDGFSEPAVHGRGRMYGWILQSLEGLMREGLCLACAVSGREAVCIGCRTLGNSTFLACSGGECWDVEATPKEHAAVLPQQLAVLRDGRPAFVLANSLPARAGVEPLVLEQFWAVGASGEVLYRSVAAVPLGRLEKRVGEISFKTNVFPDVGLAYTVLVLTRRGALGVCIPVEVQKREGLLWLCADGTEAAELDLDDDTAVTPAGSGCVLLSALSEGLDLPKGIPVPA